MTLPIATDVERIVGKFELPASVIELPEGDPLADGILMQHQVEWLADKSDLKLIEKGRRTGITYAEAQDDTITVATTRADGGDNVFYIGDTKEKGLEFIGYCAHFAKVIAQALSTEFSDIEEVVFKDQQPDGTTREITSYRIRFASGFRVQALSSRPANIRGLQGIVVIDEAAFHPDVQGVIDAATALIIWGGKIRIISTHNGVKSPFNELIKDTRAGKYAFSLHRVSFDDAVANGLFERVALVKGWPTDDQTKQDWYDRVRGAYGSNKSAMLEELDVVPRDGSGVAIPSVQIENCMHEVRPVVRLALDDEFALRSEQARASYVADWIRDNIDPLIELLDPNLPHVFGEDYARHADFTIFAPLSIDRLLTRKCPFMVELHNVPTRQQEQIIWYIIQRLPNFRKGAMDATGSGATLAEYTADKFGHARVEQVMLNNNWYRDNMIPFRDAFADQTIDLPRHADILNDLRDLQMVDGIIKLLSLRSADSGGELKRHGDAAIALALAWWASLNITAEFGWTPAPNKSSRWDGDPDDDTANQSKSHDSDLHNQPNGAW